MRHLAIGAAAVLACVGAARAEPGGASTVYGPEVTQGEAEFEYRAAVFDGGALDGAAVHRVEAGYAFTDWWRPALVLQGEDFPGAGAELAAISIENVFDFEATEAWPLHLGGYLEYSFGQNGADDAVEIKLLGQRQDGALTTRLNLIAERDVGAASSEWEYGYAVRFAWRASDRWGWGVEGFGEPEVSAHYWGPRVSFEIGEAQIALAYLAALDDGDADGQFRVAFEVEN